MTELGLLYTELQVTETEAVWGLRTRLINILCTIMLLYNQGTRRQATTG